MELDGLESLMAALEPTVRLRVPNRLGVGAPELACTLAFRRLADFAPERLARGHALTSTLLRIREALADGADGRTGAGQLAERLLVAAGDSELASLVRERPAAATTASPSGASAVDSLLGMVQVPTVQATSSLALETALGAAAAAGSGPAVAAALAAVDYRLTLQLATFADAPALRELEAAWRGLKHLVDQVDFRENIRLELVQTSKPELHQDLEDAPELTQSGLYKHLYSRAFGVLGGKPYGVVCATFEVGAGGEDLALLQRCAAVSAMGAATMNPRLAMVEDHPLVLQGMEALLRAIAKEEGRFGIRANSVALGVIDAGMFHRLVESGELSQAYLDASKRNIALRRFGTASEVAEAAAFLASSRASYITGQMLMLDGGYSV